MSNRDIDDEIQSLNRELEALTLEFEKQTKRISSRLSRLEQKKSSKTNPFKVGDTVKITNNYKGYYGTIGVVTRVTSKQVTLVETLTNGSRYHIRSYNNIQIYTE
jgi:chromosome segregation ATPase